MQLEKQRRLGNNACFVRILKYVITDNNLYVISELCDESLKQRILVNSPPQTDNNSFEVLRHEFVTLLIIHDCLKILKHLAFYHPF